MSTRCIRGEVMLLENLRFHGEEEQNDESFARALAQLADVYVNDAFGNRAPRACVDRRYGGASSRHAPPVFLFGSANAHISQSFAGPARPFLAILGGAKVSDKNGVIRNLLDRVDVLLIGGAMAYTFLRAQGEQTGKSLVEEGQISLANDLSTTARAKHVRMLVPIDHVIATEAKEGTASTVVRGNIPEGQMVWTSVPKTIAAYRGEIARAHTIFWNGPLGLFEIHPV